MAGLRKVFFDTSVLIAGVIDFGRGPHHALLLMDAVAEGPHRASDDRLALLP